MTLTYRQMETSDIPATLAVRLSTVENAVTMEELENDYGVTPQSMADGMASSAKGWLCEDGRKVVGFAMGDMSDGEVTVVAVRPGYEGRSIGKTLLAHVRDWLFGEGHEEIWLLANPDPDVRATGFYSKLGWTETGVMQEDDQVLKLKRAEPA